MSPRWVVGWVSRWRSSHSICVLEPHTLVVLLIEVPMPDSQMIEGGKFVWERSMGTTRLYLGGDQSIAIRVCFGSI